MKQQLQTQVFNDNSRILAIKSSGNVFAAEAVEELNYKAKSWNDLLTGEEFTKRVSLFLFFSGRDMNNIIDGAWNFALVEVVFFFLSSSLG